MERCKEEHPQILRKLKNFLALLAVAVYAAGCFALNENIRRACTHGNCVHGWYSKYTTHEKVLFFLWAVGYPVGLGALALVASSFRRNSDGAAESAQKTTFTVTATPLKHGTWRRVPDKSATARKNWACLQCRAEIKAGKTYWYYETGDGRYSSRSRFCEACRRDRVRQARA